MQIAPRSGCHDNRSCSAFNRSWPASTLVARAMWLTRRWTAMHSSLHLEKAGIGSASPSTGTLSRLTSGPACRWSAASLPKETATAPRRRCPTGRRVGVSPSRAHTTIRSEVLVRFPLSSSSAPKSEGKKAEVAPLSRRHPSVPSPFPVICPTVWLTCLSLFFFSPGFVLLDQLAKDESGFRAPRDKNSLGFERELCCLPASGTACF